MEDAKIDFSKIEGEAEWQLALGRWNRTTSSGTYDEFVNYLLRETRAGREFARKWGAGKVRI